MSSPERPPPLLSKQVQFDEQVSYLPTCSILLTPELIEDLWYSRSELDECKLQVRNDFIVLVKQTTMTSSSSCAATTTTTARQEEEKECGWVGMERYWDAVHISSTQKGLKQAVLQAQQELRKQQQQQQQGQCYPHFHHHHYDSRHYRLADISQQWSRSCQERAWRYAGMVTEQVYGKKFVDDKRVDMKLQQQQPQQQQQRVIEKKKDSSYHAYDYYMETEVATRHAAAAAAASSYAYHHQHHHDFTAPGGSGGYYYYY
jgi:hypothetical protein